MSRAATSDSKSYTFNKRIDKKDDMFQDFPHHLHSTFLCCQFPCVVRCTVGFAYKHFEPLHLVK